MQNNYYTDNNLSSLDSTSNNKNKAFSPVHNPKSQKSHTSSTSLPNLHSINHNHRCPNLHNLHWTKIPTSPSLLLHHWRNHLHYIARLVVCTEKTCYKKYGPIKGRWRYMYSFQGLIDSLATLPFFVELITGIDLPTLTYLRVFRLIRITRTRSYTGSWCGWTSVVFQSWDIACGCIVGVVPGSSDECINVLSSTAGCGWRGCRWY